MKRTQGRKPTRKTAVAGKAVKTARKQSAMKEAAARKPAIAATQPKPAAPVREASRKVARRVAPIRVAEPRSTGVRKVGVRTAVQKETSRSPRREAERRPGRAPLADLVRIVGPHVLRQDEILSPDALAFLVLLHRQFDGRRLSLLARRHERQARFDAGELPDFLHETRHVRSSGWRVTGLSKAWFDLPAETVTPPDGARIAAALDAGAKRITVDFEEAAAPTWQRMIEGQLALREHLAGPSNARFMLRPRGWHMPEAHVTVEGDAMSGALFDVGLFLFHTAGRQVALGASPSLCLPKLESYLEARLWSDVLTFAERHLGLPRGTCKVIVQVETLTAAFEMDEMIFELREHVAGLSLVPAGLTFSLIKQLGSHAQFLMPDRAQIGRDGAFLEGTADLLIRTCHRRGIGAMGEAMPIEGAAGSGVPEREGSDRDSLLAVPTGKRTAAGLREEVALVIRHLSAWLEGDAPALPDLAAEAEVARALAWQWLRQEGSLEEGAVVTAGMISQLIEDESRARFDRPETAAATQLFLDVVTAPDCQDRLTLLAYRHLLERGF